MEQKRACLFLSLQKPYRVWGKEAALRSATFDEGDLDPQE